MEVVLNRTTYIEFPDRPDIDMSTVQIADGSLFIEEILIGNTFELGQCNANRFECQLFGLPDVATEKIIVYMMEDDVRKDLFTGYVDSCKQDNLSFYRDLVCYDAIQYKSTINIAIWWEEFWESENYHTLKEIRDSLLEFMEIDYDKTQTFINDGLLCQKNVKLTKLKFSDLLKMICEIDGVFPNMGRDGRLEFISLNTSSAHVITNTYEGATSTFESYNCKALTQIIIEDIDGNVADTVGVDDTNPYHISGNFLLYYMPVETLHDIGMNLISKLRNVSYKPCEIKMIVSDIDLKLGTYLATNKGYTFAFQNVLSGAILAEQTFKAKGDEYLNSEIANYNADIVALRSATEKIYEKIQATDMIMYSYTNFDNINLTDVWETVVDIEFTTVKKANVEYKCEVKLDTGGENYSVLKNVLLDTTDAHTLSYIDTKNTIVDVKYMLDESTLEYQPEETYIDGYHTWFLYQAFDGVDANKNLRFRMLMKCRDGATHIPRQGIQAYIMGMGLKSSEGQWDGRIIVDDETSVLDFSREFTTNDATGEVNVNLISDVGDTISQNASTLSINRKFSVHRDKYDSVIDIGYVVKSATRGIDNTLEITYNRDIINIGGHRFEMRNNYLFISSENTIDDGHLGVLSIPTSEFDTISKLDIWEE